MKLSMNILPLLMTACGIALLVWLVDTHADVLLGEQWLAVGFFGYSLLLCFHLAPMVFSAMAWRQWLPHVPLLVLLEARLIRESAKLLLPLAQIGGDIIGMRMIALRGAALTESITATTADITLEAFSQFFFTVLAVCFLALLIPSAPLDSYFFALVIAFILLLAFFLVQRWGLLHVMDHGIRMLAQPFYRRMGHPLPSLLGLHESLVKHYRATAAVWRSFFAHLVAWLLGSIEVWLIFWLLDAPISLAQALVIEGIVQAIKSAAFFVPAALGVQEGGFILTAGMFSLQPSVGLAASLVRRGRHLAMGIPALIWWQLYEHKQLAGRRAP